MFAGNFMLIMGLVGFGLVYFKVVRAPPVTLVDFAGMFGGVAISAVYGAIAGAAIMGTIEAVRLRRRR
jgi:hypothetical protein